MQQIIDVNLSYEKLPLVNTEALKVESHRSRVTITPSDESMKQDNEDAEKILNQIDFGVPVRGEDKIEANEKYMIDTMPGKSSKAGSTRQGGLRKPHYTRLYALDNKMIFQAACCLPLRVVAAKQDDGTVSGKVLHCTHSENGGGKLVYEFRGVGSEFTIDLKRGDSTRIQRLVFKV
ncbi:hypothetical protein [Candidatus Scalindua japonica]|uniref:hypothetical protein n=1 Tax=Candidatus Scalindua japonica TaxID=1284222 RepID=UPI000BDF5974|nr:hypothetical protein [Candidatus Scalindua japonica]